MDKQFLCQADECPRNGMKAFQAEGGPKVLVVNSGDAYYAYQAMCPHMDVALEEGFYDGSVITCHQHLWQWDVRTGAPLGVAEAPSLNTIPGLVNTNVVSAVTAMLTPVTPPPMWAP